MHPSGAIAAPPPHMQHPHQQQPMMNGHGGHHGPPGGGHPGHPGEHGGPPHGTPVRMLNGVDPRYHVSTVGGWWVRGEHGSENVILVKNTSNEGIASR